MLFGTHARLPDVDFGVTFKGRHINRVFEFKCLGVVFGEHFLGILILSMYYPELVNDGECLHALGGILHQAVFIPFTQLMFAPL